MLHVYLVVEVLVVESGVAGQADAAVLQLLRLELSQELDEEECHLQLAFQLIKELVLFLLRLLGTLDQRGQEVVREVIGGSGSLISVSGDILEVDLGYLQHLGLVYLQLRDVKANRHVCVFDAQLSLRQRPREEKEHEVLIRVLQREKPVEEIDLHRVLSMILQRVYEVSRQLVDLSFLWELLFQV